MRVATLSLKVISQKLTRFEVIGPDVVGPWPGPELPDIKKLHAELGRLDYSADASQRGRVLRRYVDRLVPSGFAGWFRSWIGHPDEDCILCVHADDPPLSSLPWNEILLPAGAPAGRGWIARVCNAKGGKTPPSSAASAQMLLAAWSGLTGYTMPGVVRELQEFPSKVDKGRIKLEVLAEPTSRQLLAAASKQGVSWLHLSPPSLIPDGGTLQVPVSAEGARRGTRRSKQSAAGTPFDSLPLTELCRALSKNKDLRLVLLNACSGVDGCEQIARALGTIAIGWPAMVTDDIAADFTFYFYQRLVEGFSPTMAIRSFAGTLGSSRTPVDLPVVWLPSPKWAEWSPLTSVATTAEPQERRPARAGRPTKANRKRRGATTKNVDAPTIGAGAPKEAPPSTDPIPPSLPLDLPAAPVSSEVSSIRLEFRPRSAINPALLVNGLHPIEHINIESPFEQEVHLCIICDTGADTSTYRQTVRLRKGVVPVPTTEIHFPALHELIERHAHRRRISFTATVVSGDGREITGQTRTALWMGAKEWLDQEDTWAFIPAFVNPFDSGVLKVFEFAKKVLRTLGDPSDTFTGYRQKTPSAEYVSKQMKAIFQTLRDDTLGITYISPPGSPVFDSGSQRAIGQVVRTHAEVIEQRLGTCHDLALLLAACAEYIGIRPLIGLLPQHTFFGYWTSALAQEKYWKEREGKLRTSKFGEGWTITDGEELCKLLKKGDLALVESTYVCQPQMTFDQACSYRANELLKKDKGLLDVVIDIYAARREVQPV